MSDCASARLSIQTHPTTHVEVAYDFVSDCGSIPHSSSKQKGPRFILPWPLLFCSLATAAFDDFVRRLCADAVGAVVIVVAVVQFRSN